MGIEFRGSYYKKDISFGKRTIKDGEAAAIWNRLGVHRQVIGPRLTRLFFSTIVFLDKRVASPNEYLIVTNVDGTVNHIRGPVTLFENPVLHRSIQVKQAYSLTSASECIVVNREIRSNNNISASEKIQVLDNSRIERVIIKGPYLYFPLVGDTVINFDWHGTLNNNSSANSYIITPSAQKFTILNTATRQWKVDLSFLPPILSNLSQRQRQSIIETKPGTLQLTFTFSIPEVNLMMDNTTDVIGDLYDAIVIDLANIQTSTPSTFNNNNNNINNTATLTTITSNLNNNLSNNNGDNIQEGKENEENEQLSLSSWMIYKFSSKESFPNLIRRSNIIGVNIESVLYRGYEQNTETKRQLAELKEIELKLSRERLINEQEQYRLEFDIKGKRARLEQEKQLQEAQLKIKKETLESEQQYHESELKYKLIHQNTELEHELNLSREYNNETLRVLRELNNIGVDLTKLLCHVTDVSNTNSNNNSSVNDQIITNTAVDKLFDLKKVTNNKDKK